MNRFAKSITVILLMLSTPAVAQDAPPNAIGEQTRAFMDTSRNRPVTTEIWYPASATGPGSEAVGGDPFVHIPARRDAAVVAGKHPLVMLSHGTGGGRMTMEWLADILVQHGFIVAAVDHWGNTYDHKIGIDFVTPWQRPLDISFALTQLLQDATFGETIDRQRIGVAGFSLGGYTAIALAGGRISLRALRKFAKTPEGIREFAIPEYPEITNILNDKAVTTSFMKCPPLQDWRIKASFAICPALGQGFIDPKQLAAVNIPLYIVGAEGDTIAPVKTNAIHYHQMVLNSKLFVAPGKAGHYVFLSEATEPLKSADKIHFIDDASVDRRAIHLKVGMLAARFFLSTLK